MSHQVWTVGFVSFLCVGFLTGCQRRWVLTHLDSHTKWALTDTRATAAHTSPHQTQEAKTALPSVFQIDFLIQNSNHLIKTISEEKCISLTIWSHELLHYKLQNIPILKIFSSLNDCVTPWNTFKILVESILK